jgi:hypothetical protein
MGDVLIALADMHMKASRPCDGAKIINERLMLLCSIEGIEPV